MIIIEGQHWAMAAGLLFILMSFILPGGHIFWKSGVVICLLAYAMDMVKRMIEEVPDGLADKDKD